MSRTDKSHTFDAETDMKKSPSKVVLVVEDDPDDVELFRFVARNAKRPLSFQFTHDGDEAIAYLKGEGRFADREAHPLPDLLLLDLKLPKRDGFEVLDWVRASSRFKNLEVYVWTGWENPEHCARAKELGAKHFVKPVHLEGLAAIVSDMSSHPSAEVSRR
jgi:CheY-like chemotaxis protein